VILATHSMATASGGREGDRFTKTPKFVHLRQVSQSGARGSSSD